MDRLVPRPRGVLKKAGPRANRRKLGSLANPHGGMAKRTPAWIMGNIHCQCSMLLKALQLFLSPLAEPFCCLEKAHKKHRALQCREPIQRWQDLPPESGWPWDCRLATPGSECHLLLPDLGQVLARLAFGLRIAQIRTQFNLPSNSISQVSYTLGFKYVAFQVFWARSWEGGLSHQRCRLSADQFK